MRGILQKLLGNRGERLAIRFLKKKGFRIIARQYRTKQGEIDIVAADGDAIVFVEVKTRSNLKAGHPTEAIGHRKQKKLTNLALGFLKKHKALDQPARFDVVSIVIPKDGRKPMVEHYPNAFSPVGEGQMYS